MERILRELLVLDIAELILVTTSRNGAVGPRGKGTVFEVRCCR
ncbi:hypothetical protein [Streptomyces sp. NPDC005538]